MYFPAGTDTDMPLEARIAELVREQALLLTKEEVPHAVTAEVVELDDKLVHVRVYTETESQKQILIGKGGTMVREIGRQARTGHRAADRPSDPSAAAGESVAEVAPQPDDARAPRPLAAGGASAHPPSASCRLCRSQTVHVHITVNAGRSRTKTLT